MSETYSFEITANHIFDVEADSFSAALDDAEAQGEKVKAALEALGFTILEICEFD